MVSLPQTRVCTPRVCTPLQQWLSSALIYPRIHAQPHAPPTFLQEARRQAEEAKRRQEALASAAEQAAALSSPWLNEAPETTVSASNPDRWRPCHFKGISPAQKAAILATQAAQVKTLRSPVPPQKYFLTHLRFPSHVVVGNLKSRARRANSEPCGSIPTLRQHPTPSQPCGSIPHHLPACTICRATPRTHPPAITVAPTIALLPPPGAQVEAKRAADAAAAAAAAAYDARQAAYVTTAQCAAAAAEAARRQQAAQVAAEQQRQAVEAAKREAERADFLNSQQPRPEYFAQFGTSHR